MYPIEKYRYFTSGNKVIAVSTYAGRTVRGVAICDEQDKFDLQKGKELAAARCATKIARKRFNRANKKIHEAAQILADARGYKVKMDDYWYDASVKLDEALQNEARILCSL